MKIVISEPVLGFRGNAAEYRTQIENALRSSDVEVDFGRVTIMSNSWADECIAKLMVSYGQEVFKRVKLVNVDPSVGRTIKEAIAERLP